MKGVWTAIMPQPMSTPTAAGTMALRGGYAGADGGAVSVVAVGHDGDVLVYERELGDVFDLLQGGVFYLFFGYPAEDLGSDHLGHWNSLRGRWLRLLLFLFCELGVVLFFDKGLGVLGKSFHGFL